MTNHEPRPGTRMENEIDKVGISLTKEIFKKIKTTIKNAIKKDTSST